MALSRENLSSIKNYAIDLVALNTYSYSIQITNTSLSIIADLPLDPMDNTLAAVLGKEAMLRLGADAAIVLETLSQVLLDKIGAKEFIVRPASVELPGFVLAQEAEFKRLRYASGIGLGSKCISVLSKHGNLLTELGGKIKFAIGMPQIAERIQEPYREIYAFLEDHANFTAGKMQEYKAEDVQGKAARFHNGSVTPIAMIDSEGKLCGLVRVLTMGNGFGYLSDETVNQELISVDKFQGDNIEEQKNNRSKFLLAFLMQRVCMVMHKQRHFLIIAAAGREALYDAVGMQMFPIPTSDYVVTMKLGKPGPLLTALKDRMTAKPFSLAEAASKLGLTPAPVDVRAAETTVEIKERKLGLDQ